MIQELWQAHYAAPFPDGLQGFEIEGIDLVSLDADTAGCVSTFLSNQGQLDLWRTAVLGICYRNLAVVTNKLPSEAQNYFQRLERLAGFVLQTVRDNSQDKR
jgi:hypothetical protein